MYRIELSGCFTTFLIFLLILFLLKELWWLIIGIILILIIIYYANMISKNIKTKVSEAEENFTPRMGEVYKICPYCNTKVKVTAMTCPCCKRTLN